MNKKIEFLKKYGRQAYIVALAFDELNAPALARLALAQAALETGWGQHVIGNNLFGIKDLKWLDEDVTAMTREVVNGHEVTINDTFQGFRDVTECFVVYFLLVSRTKRYHRAWMMRFAPARYFEEIQKAGWATDPDYAEKCLAVYESFPDNWLEIALGR